jgi:hypothetical protein
VRAKGGGGVGAGEGGERVRARCQPTPLHPPARLRHPANAAGRLHLRSITMDPCQDVSAMKGASLSLPPAKGGSRGVKGRVGS